MNIQTTVEVPFAVDFDAGNGRQLPVQSASSDKRAIPTQIQRVSASEIICFRPCVIGGARDDRENEYCRANEALQQPGVTSLTTKKSTESERL